MSDPLDQPDVEGGEADKPPDRGLRCSQCGCGHFEVVYTRQRKNAIIRRRECRHCGRRITTKEKTI